MCPHRNVTYSATLIDLMRAYARIRTKDDFRPFVMDRDHVFTMEQALDRMRGLIGFAGVWADLTSFCPMAGTPIRCAAGLDHRAFRRRAGTGQARADRIAAGGNLRPHPVAPERAMSETPEPIERSLFEAPPMAEQERMVEAILFASAEPSLWRNWNRAHAAWLRSGRGAGLSAQAV
jgi:hypothetical protein